MAGNTVLSRRTLMVGAVFSSCVATLGLERLALADSDPWRQRLIQEHLGLEVAYRIRPLVGASGLLECLEVQDLGYMVVDTKTRDFLEYALLPSPVQGMDAEVAYLGPGMWAVREESLFRSVFDGQSVDDRILEAATNNLIGIKPRLESPVPANRFGNGFLVKNYEYIRDCTVLPNESGICGWVAAAMVARFWHARDPQRKFIESQYLSGTNLRAETASGKNLADEIRGNRKNASWGLDLRDGLIEYADRRGVAAYSAYYLASIGIHEEIREHRPVILFGSLPNPKEEGKVNHAVVCYGYTSKGDNIVHYGWPGYSKVVLKGGFVGSTTQFRLK